MSLSLSSAVMPARSSPLPSLALTRDQVLKTLGISRNELYDLFFKK